MPGLTRFTFTVMIVLLLLPVAGSSGTDSSARTTIRARSAMAPQLQSQSSTPPRQSPPTRAFTEEKVLAWILLVMKDGRGAR
jgi:hypothetical protein